MTNGKDWWYKSAQEVYIDEMSVATHWASMSQVCKASLRQQSAFAYTDYQSVRTHRHFVETVGNKDNRRIEKCTPAKYHTLISDAGFNSGNKVPNCIVSLFHDEMIDGRVFSMALILTIGQVGGYSGETICHPHSWSIHIFAKHVRRLGLLDDADNPMDVSGDGIPQISR